MTKFHKAVSWIFLLLIFFPFALYFFNASVPHDDYFFGKGTFRTVPVSFIVPSDTDNDSSLFVHSDGQNIRIYINNKRVGTYNGNGTYADGSRMPAAWYSIPIHRSDIGSRVNIEADTPVQGKIYLGEKTAVIYHILYIGCFPVLIGIFMLLIGIIIFFYTLFMSGTGRLPYLFLASFMIFTGLWLFFRSDIRQIYMSMTDFAESMEPVCFAMIHASFIMILFSKIYTGKKLRTIFSSGFLLGNTFLIAGLCYDICAEPVFNIPYNAYGITAGAFLFSLTGIISFGHYNHINNDNIRRDLVRNQEKTAFLSSMSHAIRTPVSSILGTNAMIARESKEPEILALSSDIENAGQSLLSIIDDILDVSKINSDEMKIKPVTYHLGTLINDCCSMMNLRAAEKGLRFEVTNDPDIPDVLYGDPVRIRQIIINLLTNAVKYTDSGSISLDIGFETTSPDSIDLLVSVRDTGIGIKEENIPRLFEKYDRLDVTTAKNIEGTGLGLSITKHLLDLMKGTISVDSEYGSGSVFTVSIPQHISGSTCVGEINSSSVKPELKNVSWFKAPDASVLIVDDIAMNLKVLKGLLSPAGMHIDTASSGQECLDLVSEKHYDLIFLDHMMPEMDGIETLHRLTVSVPVIMLTANALAGSREYYIKCGFSDYLSKPVREDALINICLKFLPPSLVTLPDEPGDTEDPVREVIPDSRINELSAFIDTAAGLANCMNDQSFYIEMMNDYIASDRHDKLNMTYSAGNWADYRVNIHAVKSISRTLGINDLGDEAFDLEMAAKNNDIDRIVSGHGKFILHYEEIMGKIRQIL